MSEVSFAAIVASLHGRSGKTLLARALGDYFILSGQKPYLFDTDAVERGLQMLFPRDAIVIDLAIVRDQMLLFDTLAERSPQMRVVDVTHRSLTKFFELMRDTDFMSEARSRDVEPVIFYIPDRKIDSFKAGMILRDNFSNCPFVVVENAFLGEPKSNIRQDRAYRSLKAHQPRFVMPKLDNGVVDALEDCALSLSDFMRQPMSRDGEVPIPDGLSCDLRITLRAWVFKIFQEIHRVTAARHSWKGYGS